MRRKKMVLQVLLVCTVLTSCQQAVVREQAKAMDETIIEKTIVRGMTQDEISAVLGPPKVIQNGSRGDARNIQVWLFDVPAKSAARKKDQGRDALVVPYNVNPGAATVGSVEVRFDENGSADIFSYQAKNF